MPDYLLMVLGMQLATVLMVAINGLRFGGYAAWIAAMVWTPGMFLWGTAVYLLAAHA